ncbi:hypothetical protein [Clostridium tagluense]|uniref:hypothetical protein n=1 Tax=Clostridium tagluense TaxID=360422 RepID=UPI001CF2ECEB|nr:hypothetical protein [Clostridium tagluense]MCB2298880.1 hypothetical protein [Clostridium tagluense]
MSGLEYLNELKSHYTVLGEDENDKGELFYVCAIKYKEDYTTIILKDIDCLQHPSKMNIITEWYPDDKSKKILKIADILTVEKNIGNGSLLMKYLFQYANENKNMKKITGIISMLDKDHFDRLEHFYEKHGFNVVFYTNSEGERTGGYIEKEL